MDHTVLFILDDEQVEVTASSHNTLLDIALEEGLEPNYSCQKGTCTKCIATLEAGEVTFLDDTKPIEENELESVILTCKAVPKSGNITINYDKF